jgi:hypothetical protein
VGYEMGFAEGSTMRPPRGALYSFGGFLDFTFINYQKGGNGYGTECLG